MKKMYAIAIVFCLVLAGCSTRQEQSAGSPPVEREEGSSLQEAEPFTPEAPGEAAAEDIGPEAAPDNVIPEAEPAAVRFIDIFDNMALDSGGTLYGIEFVGELGPKHMPIMEDVRCIVESPDISMNPTIQTTDGRFWRAYWNTEMWEITEYQTDFQRQYTLVASDVLMDESGNYYSAWNIWNWNFDGVTNENDLKDLHLNASEIKGVWPHTQDMLLYLTKTGDLYWRADGADDLLVAGDIQSVHIGRSRYIGTSIFALTNDNVLQYYIKDEDGTDLFANWEGWETLGTIRAIYPQYEKPVLQMEDGSYRWFHEFVREAYPPMPSFQIPDGFTDIAKAAVPTVNYAKAEVGYETRQCFVILTTDGSLACLLLG